MNNLIQKSLITVSVIFVLLSSGAQAATFNKLMKLGVVNSNSSNKEVVIYNDDQTKCLSAFGRNGERSKSLAYTSCDINGADTWVITNVGKIKNKRSGKCLSTPAGQDKLVLMHCNYMHFKNDTAHDFIIFDHLVKGDSEGSEIADVRY
jgi:hypothetical protein